MNHFPKNLLIILLGINLLASCSSNGSKSSNQSANSTSEPKTEILDITVSILPQEYFVKKIGGDRVSVNSIVPSGAEPATYEPKPQQMKSLSEAEAYISVGVPFEKAWLDRIASSNPQMLMIDSAEGIERMTMKAHDHGEEKHEGHEGHDHGEEEHEEHKEHEMTVDPHIWLSPPLVKIQGENIYQGLIKLDPAGKEEYQANWQQFQQEIDQLHQTIQQNLASVTNRQFIVFHPAWGYFAREYELQQIPIEVGGQEPSAAELAQLIQTAQLENIQVIFAQPEFSTKAATTIAQQIGGEVILVTSLAPDWSENLLQVSETFAQVLQEQGNLGHDIFVTGFHLQLD